jgi:hypothetical protein
MVEPVYTQRQLKMFNDDRAKLMTEQRLRRGVSQQLPRARYQSTEGDDRVEKQKLKHALGKVNILADGALQVPDE